MIAICWKCLYIFQIRGRYQDYRDWEGTTHKSYRECPKCRSTKLMISKSFDLNEMAGIQKRIKEGRLDVRGPKKILSLDDIDPDIVFKWCNNRTRGLEEDVSWIRRKGYEYEEAWAITEKLFRWQGFHLDRKGKVKMPVYEEPPEPPGPEPGPGDDNGTPSPPPPDGRGRKKKPLKSGTIEELHRRYKGWRERNPRATLRHQMVKDWILSLGVGKLVADRWAREYMQKHKPKEYS